MKLLRRHSGKPVHVDFVLYVETLSPWPSKYGTIAVQWHRGKRSGQTKPATPSSQRASAISNYSFREIIILPATIYRSGEGFEPKECALFIVHVDEKGKEIEILGAVEFSLTDYIKQSISRQIFHIECAPSIWAPGSGRPTLTLGIGISRQGEELDRVVEELKAYCALDEADIPSRLSTDDEASRPSSRAASRTHFGDVLDGDSPGQAASMNDVSTLGSTFSKTTKRPTLATTQVLSSHDSKYIGAEYDEDGILVESQEYNVPTKSMAGEQKVDEVKQGRSIAMDDNTETIEKFYKEHEQNRPLPESKKHEEDSDNRIDRSGRSDQDEGLQGGYGVKRNLERQLSEISGGLQRPYSVTNTE